MNQSIRLMAILQALPAVGRVVDAGEVRATIGAYEGDAGRRMFRRDLRWLRDRGLVESDLSTTEVPNRKGLRRRFVGKPTDLELSHLEHAALERARDRIRPGPAAAAVLEPSGVRELDLVVRLVRYVEEHEQDVPIAGLAEALGATDAELLAVVARVDDDLEGGVGRFTYLRLDYADDDPDDITAEPQPISIGLLRAQISSGGTRSPVRDRGLAALGFFPYSLTETDERLSLIAEARAGSEVRAGDRQPLESAAIKLRQWRANLLTAGLS